MARIFIINGERFEVDLEVEFRCIAHGEGYGEMVLVPFVVIEKGEIKEHLYLLHMGKCPTCEAILAGTPVTVSREGRPVRVFGIRTVRDYVADTVTSVKYAKVITSNDASGVPMAFFRDTRKVTETPCIGDCIDPSVFEGMRRLVRDEELVDGLVEAVADAPEIEESAVQVLIKGPEPIVVEAEISLKAPEPVKPPVFVAEAVEAKEPEVPKFNSNGWPAGFIEYDSIVIALCSCGHKFLIAGNKAIGLRGLHKPALCGRCMYPEQVRQPAEKPKPVERTHHCQWPDGDGCGKTGKLYLFDTKGAKGDIERLNGLELCYHHRGLGIEELKIAQGFVPCSCGGWRLPKYLVCASCNEKRTLVAQGVVADVGINPIPELANVSAGATVEPALTPAIPVMATASA